MQGVIDLWIERQGFDRRPSVADVAEGLDISVEEVQALLAEVSVRRVEVESGIAQERERLSQEQRSLAEEKARLWQAENCLVEYHVQRSELHQARVEVRQRLVLKPRPPTRRVPLRPSPRSTAPDNIMMTAVTLILTGSGLLLFWSILSALF